MFRYLKNPLTEWLHIWCITPTYIVLRFQGNVGDVTLKLWSRDLIKYAKTLINTQNLINLCIFTRYSIQTVCAAYILINYVVQKVSYAYH